MDLPNLTPEHVSEVVRDALAGTDLSDREIERRTGIPRNTLDRRLAAGTLTVPDGIAIARLLGVRLSAIVAKAEEKAA